MLRLIMEMSWRWAAVRGQPLSSEEVGEATHDHHCVHYIKEDLVLDNGT